MVDPGRDSEIAGAIRREGSDLIKGKTKPGERTEGVEPGVGW